MREGSGDDLAAHCEKVGSLSDQAVCLTALTPNFSQENIPFEGFRSFHEVQRGVDAVFGGTLTLVELCTGRNGHAEWY